MTNSLSDYSPIENAFFQNDRSLIQKVYEENFIKVKRFIIANNGTEEDAKDVFQEAFIVLWKKAELKEGNFKTFSEASAFIYRVSKNKWFDELKSKRIKMTVNTDKIDLTAVIEEIEEDNKVELEIMKKALQKLGEKCQKILHKFYFQKKTMDEIGKEENLDSASARNQKYRCMKKMKELVIKG